MRNINHQLLDHSVLCATAVVLLFAVALSGCQAPAVYTPTAISAPGKGKLIVYWPGQRWGEKSGQMPAIQLAGTSIGLIRYKHYIERELHPGTYELKLTGADPASNWDGPERSFPAKIEAGENLFVRLQVKYDQRTNKLLEGRMQFSVTFLPRAEKSAVLEMAGLKQQER